MYKDTFIFDGVVHIVDYSYASRATSELANVERASVVRWLHETTGLTSFEHEEEFLKGDTTPAVMAGDSEANFDVLFTDSFTDMAVLGTQPLQWDEYVISGHSAQINHRFATKYPDRSIFCGGVEPVLQKGGLNEALESIEYQVRELGATSMKFYPFEWAADDPEIAYPLIEKCRSEGINILQFHLCMPHQLCPIELQRPNTLQAPARDFPDLTFIMHHPLPLYFDETVSIAARFPNIHLLISPLVQMSMTKPRLVQHQMGELLERVGSEKLIYGSEGAWLGDPTPFIQAVMDWEIPADLREGYGYPQITKKDKENILGLNLARLFNIDVEAKKLELAALPVGA